MTWLRAYFWWEPSATGLEGPFGAWHVAGRIGAIPVSPGTCMQNEESGRGSQLTVPWDLLSSESL